LLSGRASHSLARPHYDVDVRLPQGAIARLEVDPATLQIAWRNPAIVEK
jgi:hypothetical protein